MRYTHEASVTLTPTVKWKKPDKKVWNSMKRRLSQGRSLSVDIGWFRGNMHVGKNGLVLPTAQIAKWNEEGHMTGGMYGMHYVPPRPFIRVGFYQSIISDRSTRDLFITLTRDVAEGRISWQRAYNILGARLLVRMQKAIKMDIYVPNKPLTIALKGHGVTLIDTGQMVNSVEYKISRSRG